MLHLHRTSLRGLVSLLSVMSLLSVAHGAGPAARFTEDPTQADKTDLKAGHIEVWWSVEEDGHWIYELQSASTEAFAEPLPRYTGRDTGSFISGLEDGDHFFRVRARAERSEAWGPWSAPVAVRIHHHSLSTALWFFGFGAVLFGLTAGYIVVNAWRTRGGEVVDG